MVLYINIINMSKLFEITIGLTPTIDELTFIEDFGLDDILARALPLTPGIRRGDVIRLEEFGRYLNYGKAIYDGRKLIPLADAEDECGHLPREFTVNEFGAHYFREVIGHNKLVWAQFDDYTVDGDVIEARMDNITYIIRPSERWSEDDVLTRELAHRMIAYEAFDYTDDPLTLEYWYTGEFNGDSGDDTLELTDQMQQLSVDIHSETFQRFMTACTDLEAEAGCTAQEAEQRVIAQCDNRDRRFKNLVRALVRYDYHGAPSNFQPEHDHEKTIIEWAEGVIEEENSEAIDEVIDSYKRGYIPDCFNFMENHFC
jgi:hypothetical protein